MKREGLVKAYTVHDESERGLVLTLLSENLTYSSLSHVLVSPEEGVQGGLAELPTPLTRLCLSRSRGRHETVCCLALCH